MVEIIFSLVATTYLFIFTRKVALTSRSFKKFYLYQKAGISNKSDGLNLISLFSRNRLLDSAMRNTPIATPESHHERERIHRRDLVNS